MALVLLMNNSGGGVGGVGGAKIAAAEIPSVVESGSKKSEVVEPGVFAYRGE